MQNSHKPKFKSQVTNLNQSKLSCSEALPPGRREVQVTLFGRLLAEGFRAVHGLKGCNEQQIRKTRCGLFRMLQAHNYSLTANKRADEHWCDKCTNAANQTHGISSRRKKKARAVLASLGAMLPIFCCKYDVLVQSML